MAIKSGWQEDIDRAKRAVRWSVDRGELGNNFLEFDRLFSGSKFTGRRSELDEIRGAMKRYAEQEAGVGEDKLMDESRIALQFIEEDYTDGS